MFLLFKRLIGVIAITGFFILLALSSAGMSWIVTRNAQHIYVHGGSVREYVLTILCILCALFFIVRCIEILFLAAEKHKVVNWPTDGGNRVENPNAPLFKLFSPLEFEVLRTSIGADYATHGWQKMPYTPTRYQLNQYDWKRVLVSTPPKQSFLASYADTYATIRNIYGTESMRGGMIAAKRTTLFDRLFFLGPQHLVVFPSGLVVITHRKGLWW